MNNRGAIPRTTNPLQPFQRSSMMQRTPPQQNSKQTSNTTPESMEDSVYQCEVCLVTNDDSKVCCDSCNLWFHFKCVHVTSEVEHYDWFCTNCIRKRQEAVVNADNELMGAVGQTNTTNGKGDRTEIHPNATNSEIPSGVVNNPVVRKSKSLASASSTSSRKKALALKRLEEEQQLQRVRDEEERLRREEERRQRAVKDKEYLDKKYSILNLDSDSSLSYDGCDDNLNPSKMDDVRRWTEEVVSKIGSVIPSTERWSQDFMNDQTSKIIPQMNSTKVFQPPSSQPINIMDEPTPQLVKNVTSSSEATQNTRSNFVTKSLLGRPVSVNNQPGNAFNIDVQSTQPNSVTLQRKSYTEPPAQWVQKMFGSQQSDMQRIISNQPEIPTGSDVTMPRIFQESNNQRVALSQQTTGQQVIHEQLSSHSQPLSTNNQMETPSCSDNTQTMASKFQTFVQSAGSNNVVTQSYANNPASMVQSLSYTASQMMTQANTTYIMANQQPVVPSQAFLPNSHDENNFYVNAQPIVSHQLADPSYVLTTANDQTLSSTHQTPIWSHMSQASMNPSQTLYQQSRMGNQQPIMSSQTSFMPNQRQFTSNRQSYNFHQQLPVSNQQPLISMHQPISSVLQTSQTYQPFSTSQQFMVNSVPQQPFMAGQPTFRNISSMPTGPIYSANQSNPWPINNQSGLNNSLSIGTLNGVKHLTAEQIASRQVIPKDLPKFYGDPEEWQTFFSAYDTSTTMCGYNNHENLGRLQKSIEGDAYEAVRYLLVHADSVPAVMNILFNLYGRPELIIESLISKIQSEPAPKDDNLASIMRFAIKFRNLSGTIQNTGALEHLQNPMLINAITDKLPTQMQLNWAFHKRAVGVADLATLGDWLSQIAEAACLVVRHVPKTNSKKKDQKDQKSDSKENSRSTSSKPSNYVNTQVENTSKKNDQQSNDKIQNCPACNNSSCTKLAKCSKFIDAARTERWSIVKDNKLCTRCLGGHHFYRCRSNQECKVEGCTAKHHTLLHNHEKSSESQSTKNGQSSESSDEDGNNSNNSSGKFSSNAAHAKSNVNERVDIFRIVPIKVFHNHKFVETFAYLDDGSNMTTMEESLAKELNIHGTSSPICVDWAFGQTHSSVESKIISTRISGCFDNAQQYELDNVRTVKELHLPTQTISQSWIERFNHLKKVPISTYDSAKPRMLICLQYSRLMVSLHTIEGTANEPIVCKTRLGWVVQGPSYANGSQPNRKYSMNMCECQNNDIKLHQLVKEYFSTENLGVKVTDTSIESEEIQRARHIMDNLWHRFVLEHMPTLTKRTKWFKPVAPIKVGDIVVVVDERNERNTWPKGIVETILPSKSGIIRQVMVRTAKGIRRRSVGKLAILDVEPPRTQEVKQNQMGSVNGEGNVGQHRRDVNAGHSATTLPDGLSKLNSRKKY